MFPQSIGLQATIWGPPAGISIMDRLLGLVIKNIPMLTHHTRGVMGSFKKIFMAERLG